jgi:signal transduction histidine kinase
MMEAPLRVLLIEDSEEDARLVERELKRGGFCPCCTRVEDAQTLQYKLEERPWDVIITDYTLPHFDGLAAFRIFQKTGLDIPFIIVSGSIGEDLAVAAMRAGIHDYVMKHNLARLVPAIQRELRDAADRHARRAAEARLRDAERLRIVGELTASLIHDLKNPLQSILSSAELLNENDLDEVTRDRYCNLIDRQVHRVLAMSEEVLEFVRGNIRLNLEPIHMAGLIGEVIETYEGVFAKSGITLAGPCERAELPQECVVCDRQRIWRALQNLISNAKDAMADGGLITFRVEHGGDRVVIEVIDTGKGIPETIRPSLFEPFVSHGKQHGTGLGLAIVKNIVDAHQGRICFESEIGYGTTFRIELPLRPVSPDQKLAAVADQVAPSLQPVNG